MSLTPIKVVHIITTLGSGGAQRMLCRLVKQSQSSRIQHSVITLLEGGVNIAPMRNANIDVVELDLRFGNLIGTTLQLTRAVRNQKPNLVHGWMYHGNLAATLGGRLYKARCPLVWNVRHSACNLQDEKPSTRKIIRLGKQLSGFSDVIVYCSKESAEDHARLGYPQSKAVVIPNGFEVDVFKPNANGRGSLAARLGVDADTPILCMAARYAPMKDHRGMVEAMVRLKQRGQKAHLIMLGRGVDNGNEELNALLERSGVADCVSLLGEQTDMTPIYAATDIVVVPSAWGEAFPNVLGEGMASGIPCVSTDVGDSRWIVGDAGVVVPPRDPDALADAIGDLIAMGKQCRRELGARGRQRILQNFTIERIANQYEDLYRKLVS